MERHDCEWRTLFDDACAVLRLPDSTNDGGPADLAEEIRILLHNMNEERVAYYKELKSLE